MKKSVLLGVTVLVLLGCAGCKKEPEGEMNQKALVVTSEDLKQGNDTIFNTEKGYYYHSDSMSGFRYVDSATGKEMYLCNKPECRHDGNEFCVATNNKYSIERVGMYGGQIFATAIEVTDTQYRYHLLSLALDGSVLNEYVTYLTLEKTNVIPSRHIDGSGMYIHRNVAMLPLLLVGDDGTETTQFHGTAIINLDTREVTYLDEEPFSVENEKIFDISAYGDYFYYCRKEGKKTVLHRYNIKDGTDETHKLLVGFQGKYAVMDNNTVVYTKSDNDSLCVYHRETGENEEKVFLKRHQTIYYKNGSSQEKDEAYNAVEMKTDGEYLYVREDYKRRSRFNESGEVIDTWDEAYVHVFDRELKEVATVNMPEVIAIEKGSGTENGATHYMSNKLYVYFEDDAVYCAVPNENDRREETIYKCTREAFLSGKPEFELGCKIRW